MTVAVPALAAASIVTIGLTARDAALAESRGQRAALAATWLGLPIATYLMDDGTGAFVWGGVAILGTACLATGGRPVLIMDEVLPGHARDNEELMRRGRIGQISVIAVIVIAAFIAG